MSRRFLQLTKHLNKFHIGGANKLATHTSSLSSPKYHQNTSINSIPIVRYEEIKQLPKYPNKLLIDVREPQELQESGKIPTAINIPLDQVITALADNVDAKVFRAKYGRDFPAKDMEVIFHCRSGKRSQAAAEIAQKLGYTNVKNYVGSWLEWADKEGLPK
ncbi:rhodanese domain-containing protein CG4456-like [Musca vetustissima]|uniref:rhodanese domain-containing protein CG4456-like n=1 Tax=Musca vetustissima TaxID=27455 RepID=UPI002AB7986A|nr:rhodanese domain-containing protein CG4456-like [Musca vetustissima]